MNELLINLSPTSELVIVHIMGLIGISLLILLVNFSPKDIDKKIAFPLIIFIVVLYGIFSYQSFIDSPSINQILILLIPLLLLLGIWVVWNGAIKLFYKYNTLLVIVYIIILFPFALIHTILLGFFGDTKKQMMEKKVKEQARFETLVEEEKSK
tara:strand:+ start:89 stop:550 length:462 start_codon:yes stop_codon:yes gene_type:complete